MPDVKRLFEEYTARAEALVQKRPDDLNAALVALENHIADASDLKEGDRLELRAYMEEYRRQKVSGYETGPKDLPIFTSG